MKARKESPDEQARGDELAFWVIQERQLLAELTALKEELELEERAVVRGSLRARREWFWREEYQDRVKQMSELKEQIRLLRRAVRHCSAKAKAISW